MGGAAGRPPVALSAPVAGAAVGGGLMGLLVTLRTLDLHPHLELPARDLALLVTQLSAPYIVVALALGGLVEVLLRKLGAERLGGAVAGVLGVAPLAWLLWSLTQDVGRFVEPRGNRSRGPDLVDPLAPPVPEAEITPREAEPTPVVLLVVDGADPDLIEELVAAGSLPTFRRLMDGGTSGPLLSLRPTLSPILWTTLATGRSEAAHGIHDFTRFQLPGVDEPLDTFPPGSGLQHWAFPWLERLPASPWVRVPVTSDVRRVAALWEIVGQHWPVGVYRWLVTWPAETWPAETWPAETWSAENGPAEPTSGFLVAGGLWAGASEGGAWHPDSRRWRESRQRQTESPLDQGWYHPPELEDQLPPVRPPARGPELRPYLRPGDPIDHQDADLRFIARSQREPTLRHLGWLIERYRPRLLMASFYSVDAFGHRFADQHRDGGAYERAVEARYQTTDRQLGRLIERLDQTYGEHHLLVVSDHGWDFEAGHHFDAPAGFFLAHGPAFEADRWVPGATLFHVAPLVLHLLGLPVAETQPGADDFEFLLAPGALPPPRWIADYPRPSRRSERAPALDDRQRQELRSLGYLP